MNDDVRGEENHADVGDDGELVEHLSAMVKKYDLLTYTIGVRSIFVGFLFSGCLGLLGLLLPFARCQYLELGEDVNNHVDY